MESGGENDGILGLQNVLVFSLQLPVGVVDENKHTGPDGVVLQENVLAFLPLVVGHHGLDHVVEEPVDGRVFGDVQHVFSVAIKGRFQSSTVLAGVASRLFGRCWLLLLT